MNRNHVYSQLFCLALTVIIASSIALGADEKLSFTKDIQPILSRSCAGCHRPEKKKGKLDLSSYAALAKGGKTGPPLVAGDPDKSLLIQQVSGDEPVMPDKGQRLTAAEVAVLARWVRQGAADDSASAVASPVVTTPLYPPVYALAPVISAMAMSPDGTLLAVAGWHEVVLQQADGSALVARLPSTSPRITSICFSPDGARLIAAGGSPAEFGRIDVFSVTDRKLLQTFTVSGDTLFGLSLSPAGDRAGVGCADKSARVIALEDGKELDRFNMHTDWVLGTAFNLDGTRLIAAGRDKKLWVFDLTTHQPVDPINDPSDPLLSLARNPKSDVVADGASTGALKLFRLTDLEKGTESKPDPNRLREMDHQPGPANAITYSPDGKFLAVASTGEVRIYSSDGARRVSTCNGYTGAIFAIAFSPDAKRIYAGGFDGQLRIFGVEKGELIKSFVPFPSTVAAK